MIEVNWEENARFEGENAILGDFEYPARTDAMAAHFAMAAVSPTAVASSIPFWIARDALAKSSFAF